MVEYMARDGYYMVEAKGTDLGNVWDNAQQPLVVGELNAVDWLISASITHTKPKTIKINPATAGHYPKRVQVGRFLGKISTVHYLQTGIFTYDVMGLCTSSGGPPYTHQITKQTAQVPISTAFHYEKEGTTANRRKDCMGIVPKSLDISVSEIDPIAKQTYTGEFAFTGPGGNLAQPSPLSQAANAPYNWYHYRDLSSASLFKYSSGDINVSIVSLDQHIGWFDSDFGAYDLAGYPTNGLIEGEFESYVDVGVRITDAGGTDINVIADTKHGSYAGDLVIVIDFYESANRYLKNTWNKMFIAPDSYEEVFQGEDDWFDGARFRLEFLDENSSLVVEEKNAIAKTSYEND